jgi:hypothetical protein
MESFWRKMNIDPFKISVQQLADFLVFLFQVKGLAPSTVKGYRSAISRTIHISGGEDFGNNQFINSSRDSRSVPLYSGRGKTFHLKEEDKKIR